MAILLGTYEIMSSKEIKDFLEQIHQQWGCRFDQKKEYGYLRSQKNKVHLINRDVTQHLDLDSLRQLRIDRPRMYIAELGSGSVRLSIEGSQLIGHLATKNVVWVSEHEMRLWLKGEALEKKVTETGYVIIAYKNHDRIDFLGCGRVHADQKTIANFIPKTRTVLNDSF